MVTISEGETSEGFIKNTKAEATSFGNRIADFTNKLVVGEIKNVKYQHYSSQIKGFMEIAEKNGKKFVLVVNKGTKLSKPLVERIESIGGKILQMTDKGLKTLNEFSIPITEDQFKLYIQYMDPRKREVIY